MRENRDGTGASSRRVRRTLALALALTTSTLTGCLEEFLGGGSQGSGGSPVGSLVGTAVSALGSGSSGSGYGPSSSTPTYTPVYTPTYGPTYTPSGTPAQPGFRPPTTDPLDAGSNLPGMIENNDRVATAAATPAFDPIENASATLPQSPTLSTPPELSAPPDLGTPDSTGSGWNAAPMGPSYRPAEMETMQVNWTPNSGANVREAIYFPPSDTSSRPDPGMLV